MPTKSRSKARSARIRGYEQKARIAMWNRQTNIAGYYLTQAVNLSLHELRDFIKGKPKILEPVAKPQPKPEKPKGFFSRLFSFLA